MAGHSHWARIKRAKAVVDARRGRLWSKLARAVTVAARLGGGDPDANLQLRYAIESARDANMPKDTIERAIKKGTGELGSESFEEILYEGYGPGGAAILCSVLTDNRTRTAGEIRNAFDRNGGSLGVSNSVSWMFQRRGVVLVSADSADEDRLTDIALQCGADDVRRGSEGFELTCDPVVFEPLRAALRQAGVTIASSEIAMLPTSSVPLAGEAAQRMLTLVDALEDNDDVQKVYSNFEVSDEEMARLGG